MKLRSVMEHAFSQVPRANIPRSTFNRDHGLKTTFDAGKLIPIYFDEALPGDTHSLNLTAICRLTTPKFPIMDNMFMDFHFSRCQFVLFGITGSILTASKFPVV